MTVIAEPRAPTVSEFIALRSLMGWGDVSESQAECSVRHSLAFATIYQESRLLAMGRVVGDRALFFYLQDIVVHPDHQRQGFGGAVMRCLQAYIDGVAKSGATVALLAAAGREGFYTRYGYQLRDGDALGFGMCKFIP